MKYEIWVGGYSVTGNRSGAQKMGEAVGENFTDACRNFFATIETAASDVGYGNLFNAERNTYWGCRLFDNEADARKSFG